jgi:hypothetical protein
VPMQLADASRFQAHVDPGELGGHRSRTVTSRAQSPVMRRLRAAANENLRLGIGPESV